MVLSADTDGDLQAVPAAPEDSPGPAPEPPRRPAPGDTEPTPARGDRDRVARGPSEAGPTDSDRRD